MKKLLYIGNKLSGHGYTPTNIETLGPSLEQEGYRLYYASDKKSQLWRFLDMGWSVIKHARSVEYILIDTYSTSSFWYAFLTSQLARVFGKKYIPILHGGNLPERIKKTRWAAKMIFDSAYKNVAPSGYLMEGFRSAGYDNLVYIPNTIALEQYEYNSAPIVEAPQLLWVRSFAWLYNPKMAVDVLELVKKRYPEATLTMVGPDKDGSLEATKAYAAEKGLEVTFTGRLTKTEWHELSKSKNIFINTTNFDNTPVSVIEAMALGLPVVSTKVGGIPFLVADQENALLTEPDNPEQMSQAILKLIEDPALYNQIKTNAKNLVDSFDWQQVKHKWKQVLK